jgi:hypothetical protein
MDEYGEVPANHKFIELDHIKILGHQNKLHWDSPQENICLQQNRHDIA